MTLPSDVGRAMPTGSRVPWERRLPRLVEPDASPEPEPVEPPESAPLAERIAYWEDRERWAKTNAKHAEAVETLERLRSGRVVATEPVQAPPAASLAPKTRPVLHREVIGRDEHARIAKTREWTEEVPIGDAAPSPPAPEPTS